MVSLETPICDFGKPAVDFALPGVDGNEIGNRFDVAEPEFFETRGKLLQAREVVRAAGIDAGTGWTTFGESRRALQDNASGVDIYGVSAASANPASGPPPEPAKRVPDLPWWRMKSATWPFARRKRPKTPPLSSQNPVKKSARDPNWSIPPTPLSTMLPKPPPRWLWPWTGPPCCAASRPCASRGAHAAWSVSLGAPAAPDR